MYRYMGKNGKRNILGDFCCEVNLQSTITWEDKIRYQQKGGMLRGAVELRYGGWKKTSVSLSPTK
jgi:hypothetical protein